MFENLEIPTELIPSDPRFGCGPSLVPEAFLEALAKTGKSLMGTSHRKPAVKNLVGEVRSGIKKYFNVPDDYLVCVGNGGATCLFDMVGLGLVRKKSVHFTCGEFSSKWYKAHNRIPWIEAEEKSAQMGGGVTPEAISSADFIACTLNETSTGVMLPSVPSVGNDCLIGVDATSGAGQCPIDVKDVDVFFFSPQKVFASDGGLYIAILSPKAIARAKEIDGTDRYIPDFMNWMTCITNSEKDQTYNTPAIATLFFLNEQAKILNENGYDVVCTEAKKKADLLYDWAESKDYLSPYITEKKYRSVAVATIDVDDKIDVTALNKALASKNIANGIDSYRKLGRNQFRISLFHNISYEDLSRLTKTISFAIESVL